MYPNLEAEMKRNGITGEKMAKQLGISRSSLSAKMNKRDRMKLSECANIIDLFFDGMKIDYLFQWKDRCE